MERRAILDQQARDKEQNDEDRLSLLAVNEMCQFARDNLKKLDQNNDGYLTKKELDEAAASGKYAGKELKQIQVLAEHVQDMQKMIHHTWKFLEDTKGVCWRDLSETQMYVTNKIERLEDYRAFREVVNRNFSKIDVDGNKSISYYELQAASKSFAFDADDRNTLARTFYKWYLVTEDKGMFRSRSIPENYFTQKVKDEENRSPDSWKQKMLWSLADRLKK
jgi:Ca2+-binding EF-hand superfamily protein